MEKARPRVRQALLHLIFIAFAPLAFLSCARGGGQEKISLPPTPVLSIRSTWAVVKSPLLRIREEPTNKATVLSHIRMGTVVEIIAKSDREETIENEVSYWFRINYEGLKGWVFGSYLEIYDSRSKAEARAAGMQ